MDSKKLQRTVRNGVSAGRRRSLMSTRRTYSNMSSRGGGTSGRVMNVRGSRSVRMKVRRLQRLIPGGKGLKPDRLFLQTAQYILHLRLQVNVLQTLSTCINNNHSKTYINENSHGVEFR